MWGTTWGQAQTLGHGPYAHHRNATDRSGELTGESPPALLMPAMLWTWQHEHTWDHTPLINIPVFPVYVLVFIYFRAIFCILYLVYLSVCLSVCLSILFICTCFYRLRHVSDLWVLCLRSFNKVSPWRDVTLLARRVLVSYVAPWSVTDDDDRHQRPLLVWPCVGGRGLRLSGGSRGRSPVVRRCRRRRQQRLSQVGDESGPGRHQRPWTAEQPRRHFVQRSAVGGRRRRFG